MARDRTPWPRPDRLKQRSWCRKLTVCAEARLEERTRVSQHQAPALWGSDDQDRGGGGDRGGWGCVFTFVLFVVCLSTMSFPFFFKWSFEPWGSAPGKHEKREIRSGFISVLLRPSYIICILVSPPRPERQLSFSQLVADGVYFSFMRFLVFFWFA